MISYIRRSPRSLQNNVKVCNQFNQIKTRGQLFHSICVRATDYKKMIKNFLIGQAILFYFLYNPTYLDLHTGGLFS